MGSTPTPPSCQPLGSRVPGDCDDNDPRVHPTATDTNGDGVDQDCDGQDAPLLPADTGTPDESVRLGLACETPGTVGLPLRWLARRSTPPVAAR
ncbi:MAG: putative metal-binding motif-containing protein [Myxococcales bacterium]|nr:putative metal-binding motif-containing protein [Myxococcales bacterium]